MRTSRRYRITLHRGGSASCKCIQCVRVVAGTVACMSLHPALLRRGLLGFCAKGFRMWVNLINHSITSNQSIRLDKNFPPYWIILSDGGLPLLRHGDKCGVSQFMPTTTNSSYVLV